MRFFPAVCKEIGKQKKMMVQLCYQMGTENTFVDFSLVHNCTQQWCDAYFNSLLPQYNVYHHNTNIQTMNSVVNHAHSYDHYLPVASASRISLNAHVSLC